MSVVYGKGSVVKDPDSNVILEVTENLKTVVMQHSYTDFEVVRNAIPQKECLITPILQFHTVELAGSEERDSCRYRYNVNIPHCLSRRHNLSSVNVRFGDLNKPGSLRMIRERNPEKDTLPFYIVGRKTITIFCNHFCDIVYTSTQKVCTSKILALPFGRIGPDSSNLETHTKVKIYVCSFLYSDKLLKLVSLEDQINY